MMIKNLGVALLLLCLCSIPARSELSLALNYLNNHDNSSINGRTSDYPAMWNDLKDTLNDGTDTLKTFLRRISDTVKSFLAKHTNEDRYMESLHISENAMSTDQSLETVL